MDETTEVTMTQHEFRQVVSALRVWGDTLGECLEDKTLNNEERKLFEADSVATERILSHMQDVAKDLEWKGI